MNGEGERVGEGEDVEEWMERTQETMNILRTGEIYTQPMYIPKFIHDRANT